MIDTEKYEGHTEGPWVALNDNAVKTPKHDDPYAFIERRNDDGDVVALSKADAQLIADAPLLLADYKRLREENLKLAVNSSDQRKVLRKKANKIRAWNKLYKYHNELENDSQHHWEMRELMDECLDTDKYEGDTLTNLITEVKGLREAFITAVRHLDVESRNKMFNDMDADLQSIWLFRGE